MDPDPIAWIVETIDPVLIFPYRLFANPVLGWWVGTFVLAVWACLLGELTLAAAHAANRRYILRHFDQIDYYHERSLRAKAAGDEAAYKGINKLANEAYGKSFFLMMAMGMASLWPAFFAAAWLSRRFGELTFALPPWAGGLELNYLAPFIILYILTRVLWVQLKRRLPSRAEGSTSRTAGP